MMSSCSFVPEASMMKFNQASMSFDFIPLNIVGIDKLVSHYFIMPHHMYKFMGYRGLNLLLFQSLAFIVQTEQRRRK